MNERINSALEIPNSSKLSPGCPKIQVKGVRVSEVSLYSIKYLHIVKIFKEENIGK